jgi:hypothetical protein
MQGESTGKGKWFQYQAGPGLKRPYEAQWTVLQQFTMRRGPDSLTHPGQQMGGRQRPGEEALRV